MDSTTIDIFKSGDRVKINKILYSYLVIENINLNEEFKYLHEDDLMNFLDFYLPEIKNNSYINNSENRMKNIINNISITSFNIFKLYNLPHLTLKDKKIDFDNLFSKLEINKLNLDILNLMVKNRDITNKLQCYCICFFKENIDEIKYALNELNLDFESYLNLNKTRIPFNQLINYLPKIDPDNFIIKYISNQNKAEDIIDAISYLTKIRKSKIINRAFENLFISDELSGDEYLKVANYLDNKKIEQNVFVIKKEPIFKNLNIDNLIKEYNRGFISDEYYIKAMKMCREHFQEDNYAALLVQNIDILKNEFKSIDFEYDMFYGNLSKIKKYFNGDNINFILDNYFDGKNNYIFDSIGTWRIKDFSNPYLKKEYFKEVYKNSSNKKEIIESFIESDEEIPKLEIQSDLKFINYYTNDINTEIDFDNYSYRFMKKYYNKINDIINNKKNTVKLNISDYSLLRYSHNLNEDIIKNILKKDKNLVLDLLRSNDIFKKINIDILDTLNIYQTKEELINIIKENPNMIKDNNASITSLIDFSKKVNNNSLQLVIDKYHDSKHEFQKIQIIIDIKNSNYDIKEIEPSYYIDIIKILNENNEMNDKDLECIIAKNINNEKITELMLINFKFNENFIFDLYQKTKSNFLIDIVNHELLKDKEMEFEF